MKRNLLLCFAVIFTVYANLYGQCSGGTYFTTAAAPTGAATTTVTTCNYAGEYNEITGVVAGNSYTITSSVNSNGNLRCITVHTGSSNGPVVAFALGTVTFTAPSSGTYYININANCGG